MESIADRRARELREKAERRRKKAEAPTPTPTSESESTQAAPPNPPSMSAHITADAPIPTSAATPLAPSVDAAQATTESMSTPTPPHTLPHTLPHTSPYTPSSVHRDTVEVADTSTPIPTPREHMIRTQIYIRPDQKKRLEKLAKRTGVTMSDWIRYAIDKMPDIK